MPARARDRPSLIPGRPQQGRAPSFSVSDRSCPDVQAISTSVPPNSQAAITDFMSAGKLMDLDRAVALLQEGRRPEVGFRNKQGEKIPLGFEVRVGARVGADEAQCREEVFTALCRKWVSDHGGSSFPGMWAVPFR